MKNLFVILSLSILVCTAGELQAHHTTAPVITETIDTFPAPQNVFVHVSVKLKVLKRTAKGVEAQVVGIRMGKQKGAGKGIFTGQMKLQGNQVALQFDQTDKPIRSITMPNGLKLSLPLSKQLGAEQQIVMSGGTTMLQPQSNSLLQFEIQ